MPASGLIFGSTSLLWQEYIVSSIRNRRYCIVCYSIILKRHLLSDLCLCGKYVPSKGWAEMIRKVYEVDPLLCPSCGGKMSIIAFIADHKVIDKIIAHLKLTFMAERPPPPQSVQ